MTADTAGGRQAEDFENREPRNIFGPKSDKMKGQWWKLHNGELNDMQ